MRNILKQAFVFCLTSLLFIFSHSVQAEENIRVALIEEQATLEISCSDEFAVSDSWGNTVNLPKGKYFVHIENGKVNMGDSYSFNGAVTFNSVKNKVLPKINKRSYKGTVKIIPQNDDKLLVVNELLLETYLESVLPAKTMVVWPDEAIKAQAVAARSYALYKKQHSNGIYDISANDSELDYEGYGSRIEKAAVSKLIKATKGQYLADSTGKAVQAVSTSSSGGKTDSAENLWGHEISYLQSVEDYDSDSPEYSWEYRATPAVLENLLAQRGYVIGKVTSIRLSPLDDKGADRTFTGRVKYVILSGNSGTAKVSGIELQQMLGLNSTLFDLETGTPVPETLKVTIENYYGMEIGSKDVNIKVKEDNKPVWKNLIRSYHILSGGKEEKIIFHGKGKGHGLGLSAWGARGMINADEKNTYKMILAHYYPGTVLMK